MIYIGIRRIFFSVSSSDLRKGKKKVLCGTAIRSRIIAFRSVDNKVSDLLDVERKQIKNHMHEIGEKILITFFFFLPFCHLYYIKITNDDFILSLSWKCY